jgi:TonB family protein
MQDVIGATLLADGSRAPAQLVLPELANRLHTLQFMRANYPESMRELTSTGLPIAWLLVGEDGKVGEAHLLRTSGYAELDSLSLGVLRIAHFRPATNQGKAVGVWLPFPARIPPYRELVQTLDMADKPVSESPVGVAYTRKPVLLNRNQVEAAIVRIVHQLNPQVREMNEAFARAQMAGGTTQMDIFIDRLGNVQNAVVKKTSGNRDLDGHALQIARMMRFSPALNGEEPVEVWMEVPIRFVARP